METVDGQNLIPAGPALVQIAKDYAAVDWQAADRVYVAAAGTLNAVLRVAVPKALLVRKIFLGLLTNATAGDADLRYGQLELYLAGNLVTRLPAGYIGVTYDEAFETFVKLPGASSGEGALSVAWKTGTNAVISPVFPVVLRATIDEIIWRISGTADSTASLSLFLGCLSQNEP
jgi:hypothetical protein